MDINSVITREEYNNIGDLNYDQFCGYLMKLVKLCVEESLKALPSVMTHLSSQATYLKDLSSKFYKNNKDLNQHRPLITQIMMKVEGENPGMTYEKVIEESAKRAREVISKTGKETSFGSRNLPVFDSKLKGL